MMKNGFMNRPFGLVAVHNDLLESAAGLFRATLETEMPVEGEWMFSCQYLQSSPKLASLPCADRKSVV